MGKSFNHQNKLEKLIFIQKRIRVAIKQNEIDKKVLANHKDFNSSNQSIS